MIEYFDDGDLACFDGLSFRRDKRTGYYLNAKTHKRLHVYVWEYYNGKVPKGCHIHHVDFDKRNNEISNLKLIEKKEHAKLHGNSWDDERLLKQLKVLDEKARPKALEWHGSENGRNWHKKHYEQMKAKLHEEKEFTCLNCGCKFISVNHGVNKFCSNKCKSAYRRKSGVDNEIRTCEICGKQFTTNKYSKSRTCSRVCRLQIGRNKEY